jgi:hypothetical protein
MPELEQKIAAWRATLPAALRHESQTIAELEEHLRDHVAALCRAGMNVDAAFDTAVRGLGEPQVLAREFARANRRWMPRTPGVLGVTVLVGLAVMIFVGLAALSCASHLISGLLFAHVVPITTGYLAVLGAGLLGLFTLVTPLWRPLTVVERRELRTAMFWFTVTASVLVPVGMILGMFWATENVGRAWSWLPVENGALLVLGSSWLLLLVQTRIVVSEKARAFLALLGGIGVVVGLTAKPLAANVPIGWLCLALIVSQGAVVMLRQKNAREPIES